MGPLPPHTPRLSSAPDQADEPGGEHQVPSLFVSQGLCEIALPSLLSLGPRGSPIDNNGTFTGTRCIINSLLERSFVAGTGCHDYVPY